MIKHFLAHDLKDARFTFCISFDYSHSQLIIRGKTSDYQAIERLCVIMAFPKAPKTKRFHLSWPAEKRLFDLFIISIRGKASLKPITRIARLKRLLRKQKRVNSSLIIELENKNLADVQDKNLLVDIFGILHKKGLSVSTIQDLFMGLNVLPESGWEKTL